MQAESAARAPGRPLRLASVRHWGMNCPPLKELFRSRYLIWSGAFRKHLFSSEGFPVRGFFETNPGSAPASPYDQWHEGDRNRDREDNKLVGRNVDRTHYGTVYFASPFRPSAYHVARASNNSGIRAANSHRSGTLPPQDPVHPQHVNRRRSCRQCDVVNPARFKSAAEICRSADFFHGPRSPLRLELAHFAS